MKRITSIVLLLALLPASTFAIDLYTGANVYYTSLIQPADIRDIDTESLNLADFSLGA